MKRALLALVVLSSLVACSKQKPAASTPSVRDPAAASSRPTPTASEVASGDLRSMLLHLQRVHFAYDSVTLLPQAREALQAVAGLLESHPDVSLYIDGHTDQRGTTEYNIGLGDRRARTVIDYLARLGIERDRLQAVSFGAERPISSGEDQLDHATNRRVEFRVLRGSIELVLEDGTRFDDRGTPVAGAGPAR